eukprot:gnl/MRDRNA2_/MRDRNA2_68530_c0_seq3.p1 gnl/MRDRNA2_/MRDRNA2_68530_c0~~gnl/MRDRNA2_/MRDRNA2_68530_c0_seq3.p1  ORF type:complete len:408 (+),score=72.45 gnl/MRDRNA2_/MRDRNA2_68530_c0_seq3:157-1224(+)
MPQITNGSEVQVDIAAQSVLDSSQGMTMPALGREGKWDGKTAQSHDSHQHNKTSADAHVLEIETEADNRSHIEALPSMRPGANRDLDDLESSQSVMESEVSVESMLGQSLQRRTSAASAAEAQLHVESTLAPETPLAAKTLFAHREEAELQDLDNFVRSVEAELDISPSPHLKNKAASFYNSAQSLEAFVHRQTAVPCSRATSTSGPRKQAKSDMGAVQALDSAENGRVPALESAERRATPAFSMPPPPPSAFSRTACSSQAEVQTTARPALDCHPVTVATVSGEIGTHENPRNGASTVNSQNQETAKPLLTTTSYQRSEHNSAPNALQTIFRSVWTSPSTNPSASAFPISASPY